MRNVEAGSAVLHDYMEMYGVSTGEMAKLLGVHRRDVSGTRFGSYPISKQKQKRIAWCFAKVGEILYDAKGIAYTKV